MRFLAMLRNTLRALFQHRQAEADLDDEFAYHLEQEIENNIRNGMSPENARLAALPLIGPISMQREECREWRGTAFLESFARDVRYAVQTIRRTPLFTAAAILTLAVGIGANTTVFTFVENFLLRPLPVRDPGRLVFLNWGQATNVSYLNYLDLRDRNRAFANLFAYRCIPVNMSFQARDNDRVWGYEATGNYFQTLGIRPLLGRFFGLADDGKPGANPVLVISYRLWRNRFGADPNVAGRQVRVNGYPFNVIGVAPPGFGGTEVMYPRTTGFP